MKELVGKEIAARVKDGDVIGVGTGSTVDAALAAIGARIKQEGLHVKVLPTSIQSAWRCEEIGLDVMYSGYRGALHWGFDGADEVDDRFRLIKGKGGALFQEKIVAARCREYVVIVDESKLVSRLGERTPVPVEVVPEALSLLLAALPRLGARTYEVRQAVKKHGPVITEKGNVIVDVTFGQIGDSMERDLRSIVGVVESGLFFDYATEVWVASEKGVEKRRRTA